MKKKCWIMFLLASLTTSFAYGSTSNREVAFKDGFYGSLSLGCNWADADWSGLASIALVDDIHDPNAVFESWTPRGKTHDKLKPIGNLALGYQAVSARLYLGGQLSYTLRSKQNFNLDEMRTYAHLATLGLPPPSTVSGSSHLQAKVLLDRNEFDIDLKPGILILKNFVLYARAGAAFTRLKIKNSGSWTESASENGSVLQAADSSYNSKTTVGFRAGAGAEYLIWQYLGIALDYIFSDYGKIKTRAESQNSGAFNFNHLYGISAPEIKVTTQTLMLGIVAHY